MMTADQSMMSKRPVKIDCDFIFALSAIFTPYLLYFVFFFKLCLFFNSCTFQRISFCRCNLFFGHCFCSLFLFGVFLIVK